MNESNRYLLTNLHFTLTYFTYFSFWYSKKTDNVDKVYSVEKIFRRTRVDEKTLHLKAFAGEPTDHIVIPFGKGICGQVAVSNETFVVPDVHDQDNYLSCSIDTKAEIVVPIMKDGKNVGQIDIDSHTVDPFTAEDREMLEWLCTEIAKIM